MREAAKAKGSLAAFRIGAIERSGQDVRNAIAWNGGARNGID